MRPIFFITLGLSLSLATACGGDKKKSTIQQAKIVDAPGPVEESPEPTKVEDANEPASAAALTPILYFGHDKSELDDDARETLQANAEWMKEDDSRVLTIEGHTDETGTTGYNLALGERRARVTKDYLTRLGVDEGRVQIITYGEERPASASDSQNRRSVFVGTSR